MSTDSPEPSEPAEPSRPDDLPGSRRRLRALLGDGDWMQRFPVRTVLLGATLLLALWIGARWVERGFRSDGPRRGRPRREPPDRSDDSRGDRKPLPPGLLLQPHAVRVSDQLLSGAPATFNVSTKDGFAVGLVLQARWALDRGQLLSAGRAAREPGRGGRRAGARVVLPRLRAGVRRPALLARGARSSRPGPAKQATERLKESGIVLKDVLIGDLKLRSEFERGRLALLEQSQLVERTEANLRFKKQEIEQQRLEAEARKVRSDKEAEAAANRRLIEAKAESDAMAYILPLKEKGIKQQELEAEAQKARKLKDAQSHAETMKIQAEAEASRRRTLSEAEAYAIRQTSLAQFENLKREVELIERNPTWVNKTLAEKLGDKVQVIVMPNLTADILSKEAGKRVANGQPAVASRAD